MPLCLDERPMDSPPLNILYLHVHDMGRYCGPYGYALETPNMQKLAERGIVFRDAHCAGPTCSPSRAALLTGQCPHLCGMLGLAHRGWRLRDYGRHVVHMLHRRGYRSALCGVQHICNPPYGDPSREIGYDEVLGLSHDGPATAERAAEWLVGVGNARQPWFFSVGFVDTHRDFAEPEAQTHPAEDWRYTRPPAPLPDTPQCRHDMAAYAAEARRTDEHFGRVLDALSASGQESNTLVICTTDHGIAFPMMKCNLTHHGTGVALIMAGPAGFEGGQVCDALVSHLDIYPTICELTGADKPNWIEGRSLMPLVRGETDEINEQVFAEVSWHAGYEPMRSVRTKRHNYVRRFGDGNAVLANCDDSASKDACLAAGWAERRQPAEELYDLILDSNEASNVAEDPRYAEVLADMRGRLDGWMERTEDPLLQGPIAAQRGFVVCPQGASSPGETCVVE